jgi:hypothetical protein
LITIAKRFTVSVPGLEKIFQKNTKKFKPLRDVFLFQQFPSQLQTILESGDRRGEAETREYLRGKYHCTVDLLFDWFGISCMTTIDIESPK